MELKENYILHYVFIVILYQNETWPVQEKDVIRLCYQNDSRMVRWMFNVRPEDRISAVELRTRLKLKSMKGGMFTGWKTARIWSSSNNG